MPEAPPTGVAPASLSVGRHDALCALSFGPCATLAPTPDQTGLTLTVWANSDDMHGRGAPTPLAFLQVDFDAAIKPTWTVRVGS